MAVVHLLPNGHVVLLMTPREAVNVADGMLDPAEYPWMGAEAQLTCMEVRHQLRGAAAHMAMRSLQTSSRVIEDMAKSATEEQEVEADEPADELPAAADAEGSVRASESDHREVVSVRMVGDMHDLPTMLDQLREMVEGATQQEEKGVRHSATEKGRAVLGHLLRRRRR